MSIGEVLDAGFRLYRLTLVRCLVLALLSVIVGQIPSAYDLAQGTLTVPIDEKGAFWWLLVVVTTAANIWVSVALFWRQWGVVQGRPATLREDLTTALRLWPPVFATTLLALLLIAAPGILIGIAWAAFDMMGRWLIIPWLVGLVVWVSLPAMMSVPVRLIEGLGPASSVSRAFTLMRGSWWRSSAIFTIALLVMLVFYTIGGLIGVLIAQLVGTADLAVMTVVTTIITAILGGIFVPFYTSITLVLLLELQVRRGGADIASRLSALAT